MYRDDNCSGRSRSQLDEEAVECMYERGFNSKGLEDRVNCANMEGERRCSRSGKVQKNYAPKSCHEGAGEDLEEQQGFRKGRGKTDGMVVLRQLLDKRLEVQGETALGVVDLEKAYDTVPREMVMAPLRWKGVPEAEVRLVEGMHKGTKERVLVGPGMSAEFCEHRFEAGKHSQPMPVYHGDGAGKQEGELEG